MSRTGIDLSCMQEVRLRGSFARFVTREKNRYKTFCVGNHAGKGVVGILLAEK